MKNLRVAYNSATGETSITFKGSPFATAPDSGSGKSKMLGTTGGNRNLEIEVENGKGKKQIVEASLGINFYVKK